MAIISVIRLFNAKKITLHAEIHHQLVEVYGKGVMNQENVHKWCFFNGGRRDVHNEA
jgi:hypothetical protein